MFSHFQRTDFFFFMLLVLCSKEYLDYKIFSLMTMLSLGEKRSSKSINSKKFKNLEKI